MDGVYCDCFSHLRDAKSKQYSQSRQAKTKHKDKKDKEEASSARSATWSGVSFNGEAQTEKETK